VSETLSLREMNNNIKCERAKERDRERGSGVSVMEAGRKGKTKGESENGNTEKMETEGGVTVICL